MTKEKFEKLWKINYPNTVPISYLFKNDYSERWFRIHSLPESKRYPENEKEWKILLSRQNEIITDLFEIDTPILIVTGEYNWGNDRTSHITKEELVFKNYDFVELDKIDLFEIESEQYDEIDIYRPAFAETNWNIAKQKDLIKEIANDRIRAFFVSFEKNIIVAPYDGGIDFVLKDVETKKYYKSKYQNWLSERKDGL